MRKNSAITPAKPGPKSAHTVDILLILSPPLRRVYQQRRRIKPKTLSFRIFGGGSCCYATVPVFQSAAVVSLSPPISLRQRKNDQECTNDGHGVLNECRRAILTKASGKTPTDFGTAQSANYCTDHPRDKAAYDQSATDTNGRARLALVPGRSSPAEAHSQIASRAQQL